MRRLPEILIGTKKIPVAKESVLTIAQLQLHITFKWHTRSQLQDDDDAFVGEYMVQIKGIVDSL